MRVSLGKKLHKPLGNESACQREYGKRMAGIIFRRLNQLLASPTLETMRDVGRCHELSADWEGCFALDLVHPYRLVFMPDDERKCYLEGRSIIWKKVVSVEIIDITDYH